MATMSALLTFSYSFSGLGLPPVDSENLMPMLRFCLSPDSVFLGGTRKSDVCAGYTGIVNQL